jgi:hypothetical protein
MTARTVEGKWMDARARLAPAFIDTAEAEFHSGRVH